MDAIPFDGFELRSPAPDIFGGDEAVTPAPHYFSPLADWHLKNLANRAIVEAKAAYLYLAVDRPKNAVNGWYVTGEKVYLTLDEAKQHGESRYKAGHRGGWDVSDAYAHLIAASHQPRQVTPV